MQRIIFSPCLLYNNEDLYDWNNLYETLVFINDFLDCALDTYEDSVYHYMSWYSKPKCDLTMMNYFTQQILPMLQNLSEKGTKYNLNDIIELDQVSFDGDFKVTNKEEFELLLSYLYYHNRNCILFVGETNYEFSFSNLNIEFNIDSSKISLPLVFNPWFDETKNFDHIIKREVKNCNCIFPFGELCSKMTDIKIEIGDKSNFKRYAKIVAERNGFVRLSYTSRQYKNVPYYKRDDGEYIICVDTLHGFFEVFRRKGNTYEDYIGEYDFSCKEVSGKTSSSENHICYTSY